MQENSLADAFELARKTGKSTCVMMWKRIPFRLTIERIETPELDHPSPKPIQTADVHYLEPIIC